MFLYRHEQGIVFQPAFVLADEFLEFFCIKLFPLFICFMKEKITRLIKMTVIDISAILDFKIFQIFLFKQMIFYEQIEIDEIRISGERRKRLVWRIAVARLAQRQEADPDPGAFPEGNQVVADPCLPALSG